jgi:hypothetical protein
MALADDCQPDPAASGANAPAAQTLLPVPLEALERLAQIHGENSRAARQALFLQGAVHAGSILILSGVAALAFAAGTSLAAGFAWSVLVLAGVAALLWSHIRDVASGIGPAPLAQAVKQLRGILFYAGFAWGMGAFLVLAPDTSPVAMLLFAGLPSLLLSLVLKDRDGTLAFLAPLTVLCAIAPVLTNWPLTAPDSGLEVALLLMLQSGIAARCIIRGRGQAPMEAGLLLR